MITAKHRVRIGHHIVLEATDTSFRRTAHGVVIAVFIWAGYSE
jgi:hypothetical protein